MERSSHQIATTDLSFNLGRPRLLVVGNARAASGFTRVLESLAEHWRHSFEIMYFGIDIERVVAARDWQVLPNRERADPLGVTQLPALLAEFQPDLVFMCHDPWLFKAHRAALLRHRRSKVVFYCPIDWPPHAAADLADLADLDRLVCYTEYGRQVVQDAFATLRSAGSSLQPPPLAVLPHGVDAQRFRPLHGLPSAHNPRRSRAEARAQLFPDRPELRDGFVVLNANRNSFRKRPDLTIQAFAAFARDKPDVWLYLHMATDGQGMDVLGTARLYGVADRLLLTARGFEHPSLSDAQLNLIYNACDVGVNTATGEGWGLIALEHAATGAAQIVPDHTGCGEIWRDAGLLIPATARMSPPSGGSWQYLISTEALADMLAQLYHDREQLVERSRGAFAHATDQRFSWPAIAARWSALFHETLAAIV